MKVFHDVTIEQYRAALRERQAAARTLAEAAAALTAAREEAARAERVLLAAEVRDPEAGDTETLRRRESEARAALAEAERRHTAARTMYEAGRANVEALEPEVKKAEEKIGAQARQAHAAAVAKIARAARALAEANEEEQRIATALVAAVTHPGRFIRRLAFLPDHVGRLGDTNAGVEMWFKEVRKNGYDVD